MKAFLLDPEAWFRRRAGDLNGARALAIALLVALVLTVQVGGFVWFLSEQMTGTITRDNPDRPPDWACENDSESPFSSMNVTMAGCSEPRQETVEIGTLVWRAASDVLAWIFVGMIFLWLVGGVAIHLLVGGLGSQGSVGQTLEVLAWCGVVELVVVGISTVPLALSVQGLTLSGSDPAAIQSTLQSLGAGPLGTLSTVIGVAGVLWQSYLLFAGLVAVHDVDRARVKLVAALFAVVLVLSVVL
jgi:hypothetical protein